ncbi:MAG: efflux transporter outer membrane subunit [Tannerella sp.]|nr:efflux transporter outer membrane subunit [Tannerella sp.]
MIVAGLFSAGVSSCQTVGKYRSPEVDVTDLYRDRGDNGDTTTIATIPWQSYFTDAALHELIEEGLHENFDLRAAYLRILQAEASLQTARAAYFPVVGLSGQVTHTRTSVQNGVTDALGYGSEQFRLGVVAQWEVDLWGKINRQERARRAQYLNSIESKRLLHTSLVANIATTYYTLIALDEQLRITRKAIGLLQESTASMQELMNAGMLTAAAVEQSRALLLSTQVSVPALEQSIYKLENSLCVMLGRKAGVVKRPSFASWQAPDTPLPYGVPARMLALRPDVRSAELQFRAAFELRHVAQASLYPSLTLASGSMAGYGAASLAGFFQPENLLANIIGGLTQPLFAGNQLRAQLVVTKAQEEEALLNFQKTTLTAAREVSDILFTYEKALEKTTYRTAQTESLQKSVDYTQELLRAGEATYIEVLTAQQNYLNAQLSTVSDNLEKTQAVIDLYRALGGGD